MSEMFRAPRRSRAQTFRIMVLIQGFWAPLILIIYWLRRFMVPLPDNRAQAIYNYAVIAVEFTLAWISTAQLYAAFRNTHSVNARGFVKGFLAGNVIALLVVGTVYWTLRGLAARPLPWME